MERSPAVRDGLLAFYARFSAHNPAGFADGISTGPGVSVIGSGPGEGHGSRDAWVATYAELIPQLAIRLEAGTDPRGWEEGSMGFAVDEPRFVMPGGAFLATRLTGVLRLEEGAWRVVHLHFSVGVPDEDHVQPAAAEE